jgi:DNA-binding SARP family transcriptional activator/WD40 repeat protein
MRIAVLGPLEVSSDDGRPVTVPGAKERLLLAALAAGAPGVVSVDALSEILWNGDAPVSARRSLQAHVVRLRSSLEPDRPKGSPGRYVVRRGTGYALTLDRASIDALHIGDLAARGHARLAAGEPAEAERQLGAAVDLWHGDPYADWPDAPFAETERRRLTEVRAGAVTGLLEARLDLGRAAEVLPELERRVTEDPLREDWWRLLMLARYRAGRQGDALAAGRRVRALLADELGTEPGPALRSLEAAILSQDPALDVDPRRGPPRSDAESPFASGSCPYKGLAAYQVADAPLFHGRQRLVSGLVARLVDTPLLVVSGPSGAGKSSAVRAGLVPALADGALPGSRSWRPLIVTPGRAPVDVLAPLTGAAPPEDPVLLVCDQFEELWSPRLDPVERTAFLDAVLGLIADDIVIRCVVVVRGDHVGRLAEHPAFTERLGATFALVPPLTDAELREIVREPAATVGLRVETDLVEAVVTDVMGQAGALPMLSTALVGTWERRRGDVLTLAGYLEAGGVAGALTRSAEGAFATLDEAGQDVARRLFVRLADSDDGGALVRRPLPLDELGLTRERRAVVEVFVGRRLLAVDSDRLEVAHEALLSAWPRLVRWLDDDAAGRAVSRHLAPAAREWDAGGRPDDELYRGARLTAALDWAESSEAEVTSLEQEFLDAAREAADTELTAAQQRADREAAARHRTRRLAAGLAAVLVVALVATFLAVRAQREAQQASLVADANRLAALSTSAGTLDVSLLLAAQAVRLAGTPEAEDGLLAALTEQGRAERVVVFDGDPIGMNLADGGRVVFFAASDQTFVGQVGPSSPEPDPLEIPSNWGRWTVAAPSPTEALLLGAGGYEGHPWVRTIAPDGSTGLLAEGPVIGGTPLAGEFSPDGRRVHLVVTVPNGDGPDTGTRWSVQEIDAVNGGVRDTGIEGTVPGPAGDLLVDFSEDGGSAMVVDTSGAVAPTLIGVPDASTAVAPTPERPATIAGIRVLSSGAALLWADGVVTLTDRRGNPVQQLDAHEDVVRDLVVAPDGTWAATGDNGSAIVVVWDIDPATGRWSEREVLTGHGGPIVDMAVDAAGRRLLTQSRDHTLITWDMSADGGFGETYGALEERWISNRPQLIDSAGLLVAPTRSGTNVWPDDLGLATSSVAATFLDPATGHQVAEVVVGDTDVRAEFGSSVAVSPDRRMVAVTWGWGTTILDTGTRAVLATIVLEAGGTIVEDDEPHSPSAVWCAGWTPDGAHLLLCEESYLVPVDTTTWERDGALVNLGAQSIEASHDDQRFAVASDTDSGVVILDAAGLDVERWLPLVPNDLVLDVSFSPDDRFLAGSGTSGFLYVFDTTTWDLEWAPARVHDGWAVQTEWLDDGRTIATTGTDGTVALFDVERGLVRARPLPASGDPGSGYAHLVPGPDEELVVLSGNRSGRRYPMEPSVWLEQACAIVGRDLTQAEWDRYLPGRDLQPTCSDL